MRLMQVMAGARHGGAEAFFERLVVALHKDGLAQKVVIRSDDGRAARLAAGGVNALQLPFRRWFDFTTGRALKKEICIFQPDVVLTWMSRASAMLPKGNFVHVGRQGGYYDLKYYRNCDHLIGNTQDIVDYLIREGWPAERAHYVPNFVTAETAPPVPRADFNTPPEATLLLALGRLHRNKAFDVLVRAMAELPDCILWLAGEGPERAALEKLAGDRGVTERIRFLGWRDDVPALMAAADIVVCPSRHEPLGNVVIEAWAQGKPIVAAASQGPSALISSGENGLLVPKEDSQALAKAIAAVRDDSSLRSRIVAGGRQTFETQFNEAAVVKRYTAFFAQITAGRGEGH